MLLDGECCRHLSDMSSAVNTRLDYHVEVEEKMHGNILKYIASSCKDYGTLEISD